VFLHHAKKSNVNGETITGGSRLAGTTGYPEKEQPEAVLE
jgi:hypothetical protein